MTNSHEAFPCVVIDAQPAEQGCHTQDQHRVRYHYNRSMSSTEPGEDGKSRKSFEVSHA
jgi:hypothetical protein